MKDGIHPKIYNNAVVTCACGNSFTTISTREAISVEICSSCHPFYTGQQRFVDTEGRIDKFVRKQKEANEKKQKAEDLKKTKSEKKDKTKKKDTSASPSLKDMLDQARNQKA